MDELERVRRFRDYGCECPAVSREKARAMLEQHIEGERSSTAPKRGARWWAKPAAVGAMALALAIALPVLLPGGQPGSQATASQVLSAVAGVAEQQPAFEDGSGYRYTRSETLYQSGTVAADDKYGPSFQVLMPAVREIWIAPDGSGRIAETTGNPIFMTEADRAAWEAAGRPDIGGNSTWDEIFVPEAAATDPEATVERAVEDKVPAEGQASGGLYYQDFSNLPTDPDELYETIKATATKTDVPVEFEMLVVVGDLLRETFAPPAYRSALYQVASRIPGIELLGEVTDPSGRPGIAVGMTTAYWEGARRRFELIFDAETSEFLAERWVLLDPVDWFDAEPPAVIGSAVYVESGIVASVQERPEQ